MNELLIVGSVALDSVRTPFGEVQEALGGSATYASYAASFFALTVRLVGVVGEDFPKEHIGLVESRGIDVEGLQVAKGKTFGWTGACEYDLNDADTLATHLNVCET